MKLHPYDAIRNNTLLAARVFGEPSQCTLEQYYNYCLRAYKWNRWNSPTLEELDRSRFYVLEAYKGLSESIRKANKIVGDYIELIPLLESIAYEESIEHLFPQQEVDFWKEFYPEEFRTWYNDYVDNHLKEYLRFADDKKIFNADFDIKKWAEQYAIRKLTTIYF